MEKIEVNTVDGFQVGENKMVQLNAMTHTVEWNGLTKQNTYQYDDDHDTTKANKAQHNSILHCTVLQFTACTAQ